MSVIRPTLCGRNHIHIPDVGCSDCDRALYLAEQLLKRVDSMQFVGYRGTYDEVGETYSASVDIDDYSYSASDVVLVFVNGLNLVSGEFSVSGSDSTITVYFTNSITMQSGDVIEVIVLKIIN